MPTYKDRALRARIDNDILTTSNYDAVQLIELNDEWIRDYGLRGGDRVTFETIETVTETEFRRSWQYGNDGQRTEMQTSRTETVVGSEERKLHRHRQRGWYWAVIG